MAVDPKLAAGGVATVIIGGGTGYAIHNATSSSINENIKKQLEKSSFALNLTSEECQSVLKTAKDNEYEKALKACAKSRNFSDRAKEFDLDVLIDPEKSSDAEWATKWGDATRKKEVKDSTGITGDSNDDWTNRKAAVEGWCTKNNKSITDEFAHEDWYKFLKACTKNKTTATTEVPDKDFWTRKDTYRAKILKAKFTPKTNLSQNSCNTKLVNLFSEINDDFKKTVKDCTEAKTLKELSTLRGLTSLETSNATEISKKWSDKIDNNENIKTLLKTPDAKKVNSEAEAKTNLPGWCESYSTGKNQSTNNIEKEWNTFLTVCIKEGDNWSQVSKNSYWTWETLEANS